MRDPGAGAETPRSGAPIGIFDSGLGGLAVLREVQRLLPNEHVLYVGDTARRPYGPQPTGKVRSYAVEITGFLMSRGAKLVIIGCNTASVAGLDASRRCFPDLPVLGMVGPGVRGAVESTREGRIGVWGTALTVENHAYDEAILEINPSADVLGVACPELLRLAEKGEIDDKAHLLALARRYFEPIDHFGADILVLGCTDLTCVRDIAETVAGEDVTVVDPAEQVVLEATEALESMGSRRPESGDAPTYEFLITGDDEDAFSRFTAAFLDVSEVDVKRVPLETVQKGRLAATGDCA